MDNSKLDITKKTGYELSHGQQTIWFDQHFFPEDTSYNLFLSGIIHYPLKTDVLKEAFSKLLNRHDILRSIYVTTCNKTSRVIQDSFNLPIYFINIQNENKLSIRDQLSFFLHKPFFLETELPIKFYILNNKNKKKHYFLLLVHHIASDGMSLDIMFNELWKLYDVLLRKDKSRTVSNNMSTYNDFVSYQYAELKKSSSEKLAKFWTKQLLLHETNLNLPTNNCSSNTNNNGFTIRYKIDSNLRDKLSAVSGAHNVSFFTILFAAYQVLLFRYSGQNELTTGLAASGRKKARFQNIVGYTVNLLPIIHKFKSDETFEEYLHNFNKTLLTSMKYQNYPLLLMLKNRQNKGFVPLYKSTITFFPKHRFDVTKKLYIQKGANFSLHNMTFDAFPLDQQHLGQFSLMLYIAESSDGLHLLLRCNQQHFNVEDGARFLTHYENILSNLSQKPGMQISHLPFLTANEQHKLLSVWNRTEAPYPKDKTIHQLFEEQAKNTPHKVAIIFEEQKLTYKEFNQKANQLAQYLCKNGVDPDKTDQLIGICMNRSLDMAISVLAVLKSGAAYIPLDPSYPTARIEYILKDAQPVIVLTDFKTRTKFTKNEKQKSLINIQLNAKIICIDKDYNINQLPKIIEAKVRANVQPTNLAYVIYTSGSTGKPKGVMIEHQSVVNVLFGIRKELKHTTFDITLSLTTPSFDIWVAEFFLPIITGGTCVLGNSHSIKDPLLIQNLLNNHNITYMQATPVTWQMLRDSGWKGNKNLKVTCGGEALSKKLAEYLFYNFKSCWNLYGPTETTVWSTSYKIQSIKNIAKSISIGRPIVNTQLYVLDTYHQLVPVGVPGELHIGGHGLARGYWGKDELTRKKFIENPFVQNKKKQARLYRTGDLVRYLPDGNLEFIGRIDTQVKIRGFRIELGEVEAVLCKHNQIKDAVVATAEFAGDKQLVAHIICHKKSRGKIGEAQFISVIQEYLNNKLPDYMIPQHFVFTEAFPLTPNKKVDRKALPIPSKNTLISKKEYTPARTTTEKCLNEIWCKLLKQDKIDVYDSFFSLGGHSLLAVRLTFYIKDQFQVDVLIADVLKRPMIAELATFIDSLKAQKQANQIFKNLNKQTMPLSYGQRRLWTLNQLEPNNSNYNVTIKIEFNGELDVSALEKSLSSIISYHASLRTIFKYDIKRELAQFVLPNSKIKIDFHNLSTKKIKQNFIKAFLLKEAKNPFNLLNNFLIRIKLLKIAEYQYILIITFHHIIIDGWSIGIIAQELPLYYEAYLNNRSTLMGYTLASYLDFSEWEANWMTTVNAQKQLSYWQKQLNGSPRLLALPLDKPRPPVQTYKGNISRFKLNKKTTTQLKMVAQTQNVTLFSLLFSVFTILLHRYSQQDDLVIGIPVANRNLLKWQNTVGFFVNSLPIRINNFTDKKVKDFISQIYDLLLDAQSNQNIPFDQILSSLDIKHDPSFNSLFQVMFDLQYTDQHSLCLGNIKSEIEFVHNNTAKFDLSLTFIDMGEYLVGELEYKTNLFKAITIKRIAQSIKMLTQNFANNINKKINELPLISNVDKTRMIINWNQTQKEYPTNKFLHQLFEEQAIKNPNRIALSFNDQILTYKTLNSRANQLAHFLRKQGIGRGKRVVLYMDRSFEMIVSILAILKAGGVFVPIAPSSPQNRVKYILNDTAYTIILTQTKLKSNLTNIKFTGNVLCIEKFNFASSGSQLNLPSINTIEDAIYIIYTSGTTGQPKGTICLHKGAVNHLYWMIQTYSMSEQDVVLQKTSIAFDASFGEILLPLITGAKLILPRQDGEKDIFYLINLIKQTKVSLIQFVPSQLDVFLDAVKKNECASIKHVLCGGEELNSATCHKFFLRFTNAFLHNLYGPTEVSDDTTHWCCQTEKEIKQLSIGSPISNVQCFVLGRQKNLVPIGVPGELHIAGIGLASGYLNLPKLTAEKFITNSFARYFEYTSSKLYKTGDLVKWRDDGRLEFLGRIDNQVKMRGFRIEIGEIEAGLLTHSNIKQAIVVLYQQTLQNARLVAYLQCYDTSLFQSEELREFLRKQFPYYMIPSLFMLINDIPRTVTGKIDRKALPQPEINRKDILIKPRNQFEQQMLYIWQSLLKNLHIGVCDNFFELGGNSLLAVQMVIEINNQLYKKISISVLLNYPTIASLSMYLQKKSNNSGKNWSPLVLLNNRVNNSSTTLPPLFIVHPVGGNILCYHELAKNLDGMMQDMDKYQPIYAFEARGLQENQKPYADISILAKTYIHNIKQISGKGPYIIAGWSFGGLVAAEIVRQLQIQKADVPLCIIFDTIADIDQINFFASDKIEDDVLLQQYANYFGVSLKDEDGCRLKTQQKLANFIEQGNINAVEGKTTPSIQKVEIQRLINVVKANITAIHSFEFDMLKINLVLLKASKQQNSHYSYGWGKYIKGVISVYTINGDHWTMLKGDSARECADIIQKHLLQIEKN